MLQVSGLSEWIGEQFAVLGELPGWLMVAFICLITAFLTEVTSNSATCTILMPIVAAMVRASSYIIRRKLATESYHVHVLVITPRHSLPNSVTIPESVTLF